MVSTQSHSARDSSAAREERWAQGEVVTIVNGLPLGQDIPIGSALKPANPAHGGIDPFQPRHLLATVPSP